MISLPNPRSITQQNLLETVKRLIPNIQEIANLSVSRDEKLVNAVKEGNQRLTRLESLNEDTNERLTHLESLSEGTNERLDEMDSKIEGTNERLDGMDSKIEGTNERLDSLESKIDGHLSTHTELLKMLVENTRK